jgi:hypothetical protein
MRRFFWKMAGADCSILEKSGSESQYRFLTIGMLYILVIGLMFTAFCGLFWKVFGLFWIAASCSLVVTFLIGSIYRLNMLSLEPYTLRDQDELKTKILTHVIRYFSVTLFAFFTAKCLETLLFGSLADADVLHEMEQRLGSVGGTLFVEHMIQLNLHHPWVWGLTALILWLFLLPIVLKFRLKKRKEYFSIKKNAEIRMVLTNHEQFKEELTRLHKMAYEKYVPIKDVSRPKYTEHESKYSDEPFNTQRISEEISYQTTEDFVNLSSWK